MVHIRRHPKKSCHGGTCKYCNPTKSKARVHAEFVLTLDMEAIAKELGIANWDRKDGRRWIAEDVTHLIRELPYAEHIHGFGIMIHGMGEET